MQLKVLRFFNLLITAYTLLSCIAVSHAQSSSILTLYVDLTTSFTSPNGTEVNPYSKISDAFDAILNLPSPISEAHIRLAYGTGLDALNSPYYKFNGSFISSLAISAYISQYTNATNTDPDQRPTLYFQYESLLTFTDMKVNINNVNFFIQENAMTLDRTELVINNTNIITTSRAGHSAINISGVASAHFENIEVHPLTPSSLVKYIITDEQPEVTPQVTLTNISVGIRQLSELAPLNLFMFVSHRDDPAGNLTIKGLTVFSDSKQKSVNLPVIFLIKEFEFVEMSQISICNQSVSSQGIQPIITVSRVKRIYINDFNFMNNTWQLSSNNSLLSIDNTPEIIIEALNVSNNTITIDAKIKDLTTTYFSFVDIYAVKNMSLHNHIVSSNIFSQQVTMYRIIADSVFSWFTTPVTLSIKDIKIYKNNDLQRQNAGTSLNSLTFLDLREIIVNDIKVRGIEYFENQLSCQLMIVEPAILSSTADILRSPKSLSFTDITIKDNLPTSNMTFLSFMPAQDQEENFGCLQPSEAFALFFDNLQISNNIYRRDLKQIDTIYRGNLLLIKQAQLHISNSIISSNSFENYNFLTIGPKPSSLIITYSQIKYNILERSQFVQGSLAPQYICTYTGDNSGLTQTPLYRYTFILHSTFEGNRLSTAAMFSLVNNFIAIQNNTFSKENIWHSHYVNKISSSLQIGLNPTAFVRNPTLESSVLKNNNIAEAVFKDIMARASYIPSDIVYFTSIYMNKFEQLTISTLNFMNFNNFKTDQSLLSIEGNVCTNFSNNFVSVPQTFASDMVKNVIIANNTLSDFNGQNILFKLKQEHQVDYFNVSSNSAIDYKGSVFLVISADSLTKLDLSHNYFSKVSSMSHFIFIDVKSAGDDWMLDNNTIIDSRLLLNSFYLKGTQPGFLVIFCDLLSKKSNLIIKNSYFSGIDLRSSETLDLDTRSNLMLLQTYQTVRFDNVTIREVNSIDSGSVILLNRITSFYFNNSKLELLNTGGIASAVTLSSSEVFISNSIITNCSGSNIRGVFSTSTPYANTKFQVINTNFSHLDFQKDGSILSATASIFQGSTDYVEKYPEHYYLVFTMSKSYLNDVQSIFDFSRVQCRDCTIEDVEITLSQKNSRTIALTGATKGSLYMKNVKIDASECLDNSPILESRVDNMNMAVTMDNISYIPFNLSNFNKKSEPYNPHRSNVVLTRKDTPPLLNLHSGTLTLKNSIFTEVSLMNTPFINILPLKESWIYDHISGVYPHLVVLNTGFYGFSKISPRSNLLLDLIKPNTEACKSWSSRSETPVIFVSAKAHLEVKESLFSNLHRMPAIYYSVCAPPSRIPVTSDIVVKDSIFENITFIGGPSILVTPIVEVGGVVFDINVSVSNCTFERNTAFAGGAIIAYNSSLNIVDSRFLKNAAGIAADAIFLGGSAQNKLKLYNNLFQASSQGVGKYIEYDATTYRITLMSDFDTGIKVIYSQDAYYSRYPNSLRNVSDHDFRRSYLCIEFLDSNGRPAPDFSDNYNGKFSLSSNRKYNISTDFNTQSITSNRYTKNISLSNIIVAGEADANPASLSFFYNSDRFNIRMTTVIYLRACGPGEHNISNVCRVCPNSTYSLNPEEGCSECPRNADCYNGSKIVPVQGFWSPQHLSTTPHHHLSTIIQRCRPGRCVNSGKMPSCATAYAGPLCSACDLENSFIESGYLTCGECKDPSKTLIFTILIGIVYFLYQLFSIYILYAGTEAFMSIGKNPPSARKAERSYYVKSLLTYTQLISVMYITNSELYESFGLTLQLGSPASLITYGFECPMIALGIKGNSLSYQTYLQVLLPIAELLIMALILLPIKMLKPDFNYKKFMTIAVFYLIVSNQPGILNTLALIIPCKTIEGITYEYIIAHPNWSCNDPEYISLKHFLVIPGLAIWCGVVPIVLVVLTIMNRRRSDEGRQESLLRALTLDFKDDKHYWNLVLMIFKLVLSTFAVVLQSNTQAKVFLSLVVLWSYQMLVRGLQPYVKNHHNKFEIMMMNMLVCNILVDQLIINSSQQSVFVKIVAVVMIAVNVGLLLFIIWKILSLTFMNMLAFIERKIKKKKSYDSIVSDSSEDNSLNDTNEKIIS